MCLPSVQVQHMFRQPITYPNRKQQGVRIVVPLHREGRLRDLIYYLLLTDALSLVYTTPPLKHGFTVIVSSFLVDQTHAAIVSVSHSVVTCRTCAIDAPGRCSHTYFSGAT